MIAGLPGVGLSGLFVLLCALGTPISELARPQRGWVGPTRVGVLFGLSIVMVLGLVGAWKALVLVVRLLGHPGHHPGGLSFTPSASIPVVLVSLCIVLAIVAAAEVALHVVRPQITPTPPPLPFYGDTQARDGAVLDVRQNPQLTVPVPRSTLPSLPTGSGPRHFSGSGRHFSSGRRGRTSNRFPGSAPPHPGRRKKPGQKPLLP